ncbi:unnamed protein product [Soboliphyme baturini]|uniref:Transcriptional regulator n=1 Tax=Soboliphyme baturini TaxID=241478 RepID=A0A183IH76_9BILA|nr:unnamed protein product [Soboliphyme baturini]
MRNGRGGPAAGTKGRKNKKRRYARCDVSRASAQRAGEERGTTAHARDTDIAAMHFLRTRKTTHYEKQDSNRPTDRPGTAKPN